MADLAPKEDFKGSCSRCMNHLGLFEDRGKASVELVIQRWARGQDKGLVAEALLELEP